jgi:hypothetical protein
MGFRALGAVLIAVAGAMVGCGGRSDPSPLVTFHESAGGFVGGVVDLRLEQDGRATARGRMPGARCPEEGVSFRVEAPEIQQLRRELARAHHAKRTHVVPGPEAREVRLTAGDLELHYLGVLIPPDAFPAIAHLERLIRDHCLPEGP